MINYSGVNFYSTYEIAALVNSDKELNRLWPYKNKTSRSDVQTIFDKARKNGVLKALKYNTQPSGGRTRFMYSLEDVKRFLEKKIPLQSFTTVCGVYNAEYK